VLDSASLGQFGAAKAQEIQNLARNSCRIAMGIDSLAMQPRMLLAQIEFIEGQVNAIDSGYRCLDRGGVYSIRACREPRN